MTDRRCADGGALRDKPYLLLFAVAIALMAAQIARVRSQLGGTPLLSANDRSRWATIRALVEHGTYVLDDVVMPNGKRDREWYSIDMVRHADRDGVEHFYSTKPALLPTLLAIPCFLLDRTAGLTLSDDTFFVVRGMLVLFNVVPIAVYFGLVGRAVDRWGRTDWGRLYVVVTAAFATLATPFAATLNNHVPAMVGAAVAGYVLMRMAVDGRREYRYFLLAGFASAWTAANELPSLPLVIVAGWIAVRCDAKRAAWAFAGPAIAVGIAFQLANFAAHGDWRPPYAHRGDGRLLGTWTAAEPSEREPQVAPPEIQRVAIELAGNRDGGTAAEGMLRPRDEAHAWELRANGVRHALRWRDDAVEVREWDNWYDYEGTYWQVSRRRGVDRGEPSRTVYAFNVLVGHHGILSLSPVWFIALVGLGFRVRDGCVSIRRAAWIAAGLTAICIAFYLARPLADRNYGGVNCGMRWTLWMTPFWLFFLMPAADAARSTGTRAVCVALLAASAFSAFYSAPNPWSHPWIFEYWTALGWIHYP
ncbi:MAG: hypothetical protein FJ297_07195 [Planctomycetes bacterium]|nr:hypothetical protein [Planctomycetota bacterium]